jgi:hypothetical protein
MTCGVDADTIHCLSRSTIEVHTLRNTMLPLFPALDSASKTDLALHLAPRSSWPPTKIRRRSSVAASRSSSIPILSQSPLQDDGYEEEIAEQRDYLMFTRILDHLSQQNREKNRYSIQQQNSACMTSLISARYDYHGSTTVIPAADGTDTTPTDWGARNVLDTQSSTVPQEQQPSVDDYVVFQLDL